MITLLVSAVGFTGVVLTLFINNRQHRGKERAAAIERRRSEALDALVEAMNAAANAWDLLCAANDDLERLPSYYPWDAQKVHLAIDRCKVASLKLAILGLDDAGQMADLTAALERAWFEMQEDPMNGGYDLSAASRTYKNLLPAFQATLDRHRTEFDVNLNGRAIADP
ncbi:hypothetical protein GS860_16115 [Rhodococcus hoagii]|nr:hypothetical protein [Prescottella equi]